MGGGALHTDLPVIQFCTSPSNLLPPSSSSSSTLNFPVSANNSATIKQSCNVSSCSRHSDSCKQLDSVDKTEENRARGSLDKSVFGPVPSYMEVENAIHALQSFVHGISSSGPELKWLQPLLRMGSSDLSILLTQGYGGRVFDTLRMLQTDPFVKRLVASLSSDKAVWDAVMNNELVRKLRESPCTAENGRHENSDEEPSVAADILRWILNITKAKVTELIEKFRELMDEVFKQPLDRGKAPIEETRGEVEDKIRSSLVLSVVILLIVIVARAHRL